MSTQRSIEFACAEGNAGHAPRIARLELKRRYLRSRVACPLCPQKRTGVTDGMSAKVQQRDVRRILGPASLKLVRGRRHSIRRMSAVRRMGARKMQINVMPLVEIPVNVNHVLILSDPLPIYHGARLPLAKLFVASGRGRHGYESGR